MGYLESLLGRNERMLFTTRHHWLAFLGRVLGYVVLLILGQKPKRGLPGLPLLAKLELSETARQIGQLGFRLSVAQIGLK